MNAFSSSFRTATEAAADVVGTERLPLVVDLDRTLLATDSLHEQAVRLLFSDPVELARALTALPAGRAAAKRAIADAMPEVDEAWPLNEPLLAWLRAEAARGREVHLCSAADQSIVDAVAARVGLFASATGSAGTNLKGAAKAAYLAARFQGGFAYAGDSRADVAVWQEARAAILVGTSTATRAAVQALGRLVEAEFPAPRPGLWDWAQALRVHHWTKNLVVFVPLILAHGWTEPASVIRTVLGFLLALCVISSTYLLNDLADLPTDRRHWSKRQRPMARGLIPIRTAALLAAGGIAFGVVAGLLISHWFAAALCGYIALTLGYSFGLKRVPLLDTMVIATLFVIRIAMGIALVGHAVSDWLLAFSFALFFSLAVAKRHTEILRATEAGCGDALAARGYRAADGEVTLVLGIGAGLLSVLILVLYIVEDAFAVVGYGDPGWLRLIPMLLAIWIGRIWLLTHRGQMSDDPVAFALRDRASLGLGAGVALAFLLAI